MLFSKRSHKKAQSYKPMLEYLDKRLLLAASIWEGNTAHPDWNDPQSWSNGIPGVTQNIDTAVFNATSEHDCNVNMPARFTIRAIQVGEEYGGTINIENNLTLTEGGLLAAGKITGGDLFITGGTFTWSGGTMEATGTDFRETRIAENVVFNISGEGDKTIRGSRIVYNGGRATWARGNIVLEAIAFLPEPVFSNGGELNALGTWVKGDTGLFQNTGTLNVRVPLLRIEPEFLNSGQVQVDMDMSLKLLNGSISRGTYQLNAGAQLLLGPQDPQEFDVGSQITGPGEAVVLSGAHMWINASVPVNNLVQEADSFIEGFGTLIINSTFDCQGGTQRGVGGVGTTSIARNALMTITGLSIVIEQRTLANAGTILLRASDGIALQDGAAIQNGARALFDVQTSSDIIVVDPGDAPVFVNDGTFRKSAGGGTTITVPFVINPGSKLEQRPGAGKLTFARLVDNTGIVELFGVGMDALAGFVQESGSTTLAASATLNVTGDAVVNGGRIFLGHGTLDATGAVFVNNLKKSDESQLSGPGTINADVHNTGIISVTVEGSSEPADVLTINGTYTQTGELRNRVTGNPAAGYQLDQLAISGTATFDGTFTYVDDTNFKGDEELPFEFAFIRYASETGRFSGLEFHIFDPQHGIAARRGVYNPTYFTLEKCFENCDPASPSPSGMTTVAAPLAASAPLANSPTGPTSVPAASTVDSTLVADPLNPDISPTLAQGSAGAATLLSDASATPSSTVATDTVSQGVQAPDVGSTAQSGTSATDAVFQSAQPQDNAVTPVAAPHASDTLQALDTVFANSLALS